MGDFFIQQLGGGGGGTGKIGTGGGGYAGYVRIEWTENAIAYITHQ